MRAVLLVLILAVVAVIAAVATGFIDIRQTQSAEAPDISATRGGVAAEGGQAPKFEVDTGAIGIGTKEREVKLPAIEVRPADTRQPAPSGQQPAAPAPAAPQNNVATTDSTQQ